MKLPNSDFIEFVNSNKKGLLSVFGAFLIQLCAGCFNGTFGNLLPYFTSYMKQTYPDINHGDFAMVLSVGGIAKGISYLLGGLIMVPSLGPRGSLVLASVLYTLSPVLTYVCLITSVRVEVIYLVYGVISSAAFAILLLVTMTLPVTWFPQHRGKVIGFIAGGFGLSSTVFSPLQVFLVNPSNAAPNFLNSTNSNSSKSSYFTDKSVLDNVPYLLLYMSAIYAVIFIIACFITVGAPKKDNKQQKLSERLTSAWLYFYTDASRSLDFYLLCLARLAFMTIGAAVLAHWKTFAFTQSGDDQMVSVVGGVSGIANFLSRFVAGIVFDKIGYSKLMSGISLLLTINLISIYFIGQQSFIGLIICVWIVYFLGFAHLATIPAQAHRLFSGAHTSVVIGCVGLAESFSFGTLGILNTAIMSQESDSMFLVLFLTLAGFSLVSIPLTWFVADSKKETKS